MESRITMWPNAPGNRRPTWKKSSTAWKTFLPDPRQDNPLKITNDARKAGLDYRLIEPHADDFAGSKVNAAVERIYHIWSDTAADRGTQLVFCDLSTPKGGRTPTSVPANRNDLELETLLDVDDTLLPERKDEEPHGTTQAETDDSGEDTSVASDMDAVIALSSKFSVYDDIRSKLVARGFRRKKSPSSMRPTPTSARQNSFPT